MFCIKSNVITLESIEMYGFLTVLTSMYDGPCWVILFMYGSHDMRHTGFPQVDSGQRDPQEWGVTATLVKESGLLPSPTSAAERCLPAFLTSASRTAT